MVSKILRILVKFLTGILLLVWLVLFPYTLTPVYEYPESKSFSGDQLYNPYAETDFSQWQRVNFHAHSDYWGNIGITHAHTNSPENIHRVYKEELGYTLPGISDYQHINRSLDSLTSFLPVYEHGYNIHRVHQLPVNAKRVTYLDYPLSQNTAQKQHVINAIRRQSDFVILAHPHLDSGYKVNDIKNLSNYQAIEILNTFAFYKPAIDLWDVALSEGKYVVAAGNDDMHDMSRRREFGYRFNSVGTESKEASDILTEMKKGNHMVISIHRNSKDDLERKKEKLQDVEKRIEYFNVSGDTITMVVNHPVFYLSIMGDNGKTLKKSETDSIKYVLQPEDTYVRAEAHFNDHTNIFLNPVIRYSGDLSEYQLQAKIKYLPTALFILLRVALWLSVFTFVLIKVVIRW